MSFSFAGRFDAQQANAGFLDGLVRE